MSPRVRESEQAALVIAEGLAQFGLGVHDKGSGARDRLIERFARDQQKTAGLIAATHLDSFPLAEHRQLISLQVDGGKQQQAMRAMAGFVCTSFSSGLAVG